MCHLEMLGIELDLTARPSCRQPMRDRHVRMEVYGDSSPAALNATRPYAT